MQQSALKRDLGGVPSTGPKYTPKEETTLRILALIFASVSILTTMPTVYWFWTMRKSFRHHLVMILIQSDMIKALSYMIYAIVALDSGGTETAPTFCQVSGFFTTVGIELSDFAVLMIAIHSALYIFTPPASIGEGGLYPYRYLAYGLWIVLPLLMASLAFTNPSAAYVAGGASCSLPVRPFWYLLVLSWIPRYLIILIILSIDASIYLFIIRRFGSFRGTGASDHITTTENSVEGQGECEHGKVNERNSLPPVPALVYNGLISETRKPSAASLRAPNTSVSEPWKYRLRALEDTSSIIRWPKLEFQRRASNKNIFSGTTSSAPLQNNGVTTVESHLVTTVATQPSYYTGLVPVEGILPSARTSWTTFTAQFISHPPSTISLASFLRAPRRNVSFCSDVSIPLHELELVDSQGQSLNIQIRKNIRRQLRFLFVYPLAYLAMWILPFISHTLQYSDYYVANPPFALDAVVTVMLISQSTVDCWIFNIKEKPWRHPSQKRESFIPDLGFLSVFALGWNSGKFGRKGGKSKKAMEAEARLAYQRRDQELAARVSESHSAGRSQRQERSWWDDIDGTGDNRMSPHCASEIVDLERQSAPADTALSSSH